MDKRSNNFMQDVSCSAFCKKRFEMIKQDKIITIEQQLHECEGVFDTGSVDGAIPLLAGDFNAKTGLKIHEMMFMLQYIHEKVPSCFSPQ